MAPKKPRIRVKFSKALEDPLLAKAFNRAVEDYILIKKIVEARTRLGLNQTQLAKKLGTNQSAIARLESGSHLPSLATLRRVAQATNTKLSISFEPLDLGAADELNL